MNVVDSSGWLEYFASGPNSHYFADPLGKFAELIVPTISMYEVFKKMSQQRGEDAAFDAAALMYQGNVVPLNAELALEAAQLSSELALPMADSIILATAIEHGATLWTQDADFASIDGVKYIAKKH
ncbi:MAG: type II toxin-antitoxin system VapC family toxin [Steroidobacter sp.]